MDTNEQTQFVKRFVPLSTENCVKSWPFSGVGNEKMITRKKNKKKKKGEICVSSEKNGVQSFYNY